MKMKCLLLVASSAALAVEDVVFGVDFDEHLQLLQLSARRQHDHLHLGVNQGPYETLGAGSECPDDQLLTLHQCAEASWGGAVQNVNPALQVYGPMVAIPDSLPFPRGCAYWTANRGVYYNPNPTAVPNPQMRPICSPNGGRLAEKQEEAALPAGGVEKRPVNTVCDDCGILSLDQCKLAGDALGINKKIGNRVASGYPILQSNANASKINGPSPRGCFFWTQNSHMYFNFDSESDPNNSAPHPQKQPICGVCDATTTTTPAPLEEIVSPPEDDAEQADAPACPAGKIVSYFLATEAQFKCSDAGAARLTDSTICAAGVLGIPGSAGPTCPAWNGGGDAWPSAGCFAFGNKLYDSTCVRNEFDSEKNASPHRGVCWKCEQDPNAPVVEAPVDNAEAVGDPHMTSNTGRHFDLKK